MKNVKLIISIVSMIVFSISVYSCKGKNGSASVDTTINSVEPVDTSMIQDDTAHMIEGDSLNTPKK